MYRVLAGRKKYSLYEVCTVRKLCSLSHYSHCQTSWIGKVQVHDVSKCKKRPLHCVSVCQSKLEKMRFYVQNLQNYPNSCCTMKSHCILIESQCSHCVFQTICKPSYYKLLNYCFELLPTP